MLKFKILNLPEMAEKDQAFVYENIRVPAPAPAPAPWVSIVH